jgi:hypothetical protein
MERFARWVLRNRMWVLGLTAALTLAGAYAVVKWSRIESDISKYLPADDPVVIRFTEAGERFGGVAIGVVGIEYEDAFARPALEEIDRITQAVRQMEGIGWVVSLTAVDEVQARLVDGERAVAVGRLVDAGALPETPEGLARLRRHVLEKEDMVGVVVSADGRLASLMFNIVEGANRAEMAQAVEDEVRRQAPARKTYFGGFPFWMKNMSDIILSDMVVLVPIVSAVVILLLLLAFRSLRGVALPLLTVMISSVWAMGLMAAVDVPITMLSNVIPVLLIALGTAYAIHLLHRVEEGEGGRPLDGPGLCRALSQVMVPIAMAGATTVIGFLSFCTSNLVFIQHTGLIAAFGILSAMLVALTFLPAVLSMLRPRVSRAHHTEGTSLSGRLLASWSRGLVRWRWPVLGAALLLAGGAAAFLPRLDRSFNMVAYFPEGSDIRAADEVMKTRLGGNTPIWITVEGDAKHPFVLRSLLSAEKFLRSIPDVHSARSIGGLVAEMNLVMSDRRAVPDTRAGVGNLWFNLEGKDVLKQFADPSLQHTLVQAMSSAVATSRLRQIVASVQAFLAELPRQAREVDLARDPPGVRQAAERLLLAEAARDAALDLAHRLPPGQAPARAEVLARLETAWRTGTAPAGAEVYRAALRSFLGSDESDLEIEDEAVADALAGALAEAAARGKMSEELDGLLASRLPAELVASDPEGVGYLATSLRVMVEELDRARRVGGLRDALMAGLPDEARGNRRLLEELDGDLWPLGARTAWVPLSGLPDGAEGEVVQVDLHQTGMHHISVNIDDQLVHSQLSSLGLAALLAMLMLMLQFRSLLAGILGMLPMLLTLLINFGVMAALGIDLDPATVLIASLVVGVGIDYTIHFMARTRAELLRRGEPAAALEVVLRTSGRAILINAVTVMGGQLVFLAGDLVPLHSFGILLALAMLTSALAAISVLPVVLVITRPRFLRSGPASPPSAEAVHSNR